MSEGVSAALDRVFRLDLPDEAATIRLAEDLAPALRIGDVVALSGELGAGKTSFARALVRALANDPALEVPSPTYTLVQIYETRPKVTHFDLYRIGDAEELSELGFDEATETGIAVVEWPERAAHILEEASIVLTLRDKPQTHGGASGREAEIVAAPEPALRVGRMLAIRAFLAGAGFANARRRRFEGDASARRYESVEAGAERLILMDSPALQPGKPVRNGLPYTRIAHIAETVLPFVAIGEALEDRGFVVPRILAADLDNGLVLLSDLGRDGVLDAEGKPIPERYQATALTLAALHGAPFDPNLTTRGGVAYRVPAFDRAAMAIEIDLLLEWYWPARRGRPVTSEERASFEAVWDKLFDRLERAETHLLLRDVHSPNLLWQAGDDGIRRIGLIDFQDAMIGPTAYDVASLAQDARVDVLPELEAQVLGAYLAARQAQGGAFDASAFREAYAIMAAQRATKILGIFVRLLERDGKPQYLRHIPRIKSYLTRTLAHPALEELARLYQDWDLLRDERRRAAD